MRRLASSICLLWTLLLPMVAASADSLGGFVGRWQLDPSRTHMGRFGPDGRNMVRDPTFTFVFKQEGAGLTIAVYSKYPQAAPDRIMPILTDGRLHGCDSQSGCQTVGGDPHTQQFVYRQMDAHFLVRTFLIDGTVSEYSTYALSADGMTFTMIAWSAATPYWQNIQVFTRQP